MPEYFNASHPHLTHSATEKRKASRVQVMPVNPVLKKPSHMTESSGNNNNSSSNNSASVKVKGENLALG